MKPITSADVQALAKALEVGPTLPPGTVLKVEPLPGKSKPYRVRRLKDGKILDVTVETYSKELQGLEVTCKEGAEWTTLEPSEYERIP